MKRVLVLSAVLAAALGGLVLWLAQGSTEPTVSPASPPPLAPASEKPASVAPPPALPSTSTTQPDGSTASRPRVYAVGDVIIRDHRGPDAPPITEAPEIKPPIGKFLQVVTAQRVAAEMETPAKKCIQALPSGPQKLSVTMTVEVKNSSITVTGVTGTAPGVADPVVEPTLACMRERMIGARIDAAGEDDVRSYPITTVYSAQ